ncbi:TIGR04222 domain-containing membrane protein [Qipengyuania sp. RANM35]|uniref:TIGR04222 domain-containing membrane protein n=1 Tax=Qipengyuania sp. RANM35 TaxID=3068635 RepID=UPI0034DAF46B
MISGFSAYSGTEFLAFFATLMAMAIIAGWWLPNFLRAEGRDQRVSDPGELAFVAGGPKRYTEATLAWLLGRGELEDGSENKLRVVRQGGTTPGERALTAKVGEFGITEAYTTLKPYLQDIKQSLASRELLMYSGSRWTMRFIGTVPYLVVLAIGWYRKEAGQALGEPTGFLSTLLFVTLALAVWRFAVLDPRTRAGQRAVKEVQDQSIRLKTAPTDGELGLGVALFGTAILAGTPFAQLHSMRQAASSGPDGGYSSDSGSSSDGGGDGGCGGGCGGCGG